MQGFVHVIIESYIVEKLGPQHLPTIRRLAGINGPALATERYSDEATMRFFEAIATYQNIPLEHVLYYFGVYWINAPQMERNYLAYFQKYRTFRSFLAATDVIHRVLPQEKAGSSAPQIECIEHSSDLLEFVYRSKRQLCRWMIGVIEGASLRFDERIEIWEAECSHHGAPACRILVRLLATSPSGPQPPYPTAIDASSFGRRSSSGPQSGPGSGFAPKDFLSLQDEGQKRELEQDVLVLRALAMPPPSRMRQPTAASSASSSPGAAALSLFEIGECILSIGGSPAKSRPALVHRSLTRLSLQGFVESKPDPAELGNQPEVATFGGRGLLVARRYYITSAGQAWLQEMLGGNRGR